jgi:DNA (cytosine-5)-methyltransferase 1
MMSQPKYNYQWTLADAVFTKDKGTVFSCFACGGGSTMGYKLAGFDVVGCNEIDHRMMSCYVDNHNPRYHYCEPIQTFKLRDDLPEDLYNLDILDGSPPCSSFSVSGLREKAWGKEKKFAEGQAKQVLDTLFFDFVDLAHKLQPKIVIAENVKGLLLGNAKGYFNRIIKAFDEAGYIVDHWLLNAKTMGVPQSRERVFFIAVRKDIAPTVVTGMFGERLNLNLRFNYPIIPYSTIEQQLTIYKSRKPTAHETVLLANLIPGQSLSDAHPSGSMFNHYVQSFDRPLYTITSNFANGIFHPHKQRKLYTEELILGQSYPIDYNFGSFRQPVYLLGMSVPPVMIAQIADAIRTQWAHLF